MKRMGARHRKLQDAEDRIARKRMDEMAAAFEFEFPTKVSGRTWVALYHLEIADPGPVSEKVIEAYIESMRPDSYFSGGWMGIKGMIKWDFVKDSGFGGMGRGLVLGQRGRNALRARRIRDTIKDENDAKTHQQESAEFQTKVNEES